MMRGAKRSIPWEKHHRAGEVISLLLQYRHPTTFQKKKKVPRKEDNPTLVLAALHTVAAGFLAESWPDCWKTYNNVVTQFTIIPRLSPTWKAVRWDTSLKSSGSHSLHFQQPHPLWFSRHFRLPSPVLPLLFFPSENCGKKRKKKRVIYDEQAHIPICLCSNFGEVGTLLT